MFIMLLSNYLLFLFLALNATAAPVFRRQNKDGSTTVMTVTDISMDAGTVTEACVVTLTPIKDKDGKDAFEEVRKCTISRGGGSSSESSGGSSTTSTSTSASSSTISTDSSSSTSTSATATDSSSSSSTSATTTDGSSSASGSGTSTSTSASASATSSGSPAISVIGSSQIPISQVNTGSAASTTTSSSTTATDATSQTTASSSVTTGSTSPTATQTGATASDTNGSAQAAEVSPTAPGAFSVPGKTISVLPIGLGVFAGISVIALIVVGLVTYERTKYRKAFRQRKLAETGASMGYGGMAQRT